MQWLQIQFLPSIKGDACLAVQSMANQTAGDAAIAQRKVEAHLTDLAMQSENRTTLPCGIISVRELLSDLQLVIPRYQRPYKWTSKNINQLFADIATHKDKSSYRLGTIVFHQEDDQKNIVDGQQRTVSLLLAARALIELRKDNLDREDLKEQLEHLQQVMINPRFESDISKANIYSNYVDIRRIVSRSDFTEAHIDFLLNKCHVVTFTLSDISEAFQFFDSQNARGRDLEPHDLLKAYHLREFNAGDELRKAKTVERWENSQTDELASLFSQYLFRIRNWSRGASARYFGKDDTALFKGVNIETGAQFPYVEQLRIAHHFVDQYNDQFERKIDGRSMGFPFQLDQIIINGRRFFEMTAHYQEKVLTPGETKPLQQRLGIKQLDGYAQMILETIDAYEGRHRTGDRYARGLFDCLLIYYIDKFGCAEISRAIEKMFIWAYTLRLNMQNLQLASMDNYVLEQNLFQRIKESTRPSDFVGWSLPAVTAVRSTKTAQIQALFTKMNYLQGDVAA